MTTVAIIQARMGSTRFPGKALADLTGRPVLAWLARAAGRIPGVDRVAVATSDQPADDPIVAWCADQGIACHRGSETDVLARMVAAATAERAETVVRLTADCPFIDPDVCGQVVALRRIEDADYASNADPATWPDGLDCEAVTLKALRTAAHDARLASEREHVTPFIRNRRQQFRVASLVCPLPGLHAERWTLDGPRDLDFLRAVAARLPNDAPPSFVAVLDVLRRHPDLRTINAGSGRNEGYAKSQAADAPASVGFARSQRLLKRAEAVIPLGSQTFSKSRLQYPDGQAPLFLTHGQGGRVWDVDGNEYVDLVAALLPVVLGYRDPDVDRAVRNQLANGISFSLATELEAELAERLTTIIPCAEKVRFGKNGTDATSAAVRLARAFTGRDHVGVCGYHGWQDWYIGATTRNKGVPKAVRALTHMLPYNDLDAVRQFLADHPGDVAAIVIEPMNVAEPRPEYLAELGDLARRAGALLVFDEIITGFRYALGGAQALFGVTPDLAAFGKAMGNGMPISAVVGRAEVMAEMEEVFFSGTFGGETLSLAAAIAVIDKMRREPVIAQLWETGERLAARVHQTIARHGLQDTFALAGKAPWMPIVVNDHGKTRKEAIKTRFMVEMLRQGVLILGSHNICYAHDDADIDRVARAYDVALGAIAEGLATGGLERDLPCPVITPIFRVR